jgi:hypothetical protein
MHSTDRVTNEETPSDNRVKPHAAGVRVGMHGPTAVKMGWRTIKLGLDRALGAEDREAIQSRRSPPGVEHHCSMRVRACVPREATTVSPPKPARAGSGTRLLSGCRIDFQGD